MGHALAWTANDRGGARRYFPMNPIRFYQILVLILTLTVCGAVILLILRAGPPSLNFPIISKKP